jgi:CRP-like cAMP-binding protein
MEVKQKFEEKLEFVSRHVPKVRQMSRAQREKFAYGVKDEKHFHLYTLARPGDVLDRIYWVVVGQCGELDEKGKEFVRFLGYGSSIGEQCVLFDMPVQNKIVVSSDYVELYSITKIQLFNLLTDMSIDTMKHN